MRKYIFCIFVSLQTYFWMATFFNCLFYNTFCIFKLLEELGTGIVQQQKTDLLIPAEKKVTVNQVSAPS